VLWPDPEAEAQLLSSLTASIWTDHTLSADAVTALGSNNECRALARAVGWHTQNCILLDCGRTVTFDDPSRGDESAAR
jgi:hypothetical protein